MKPIINESINNGDVTIENKSSILRERYIYFRSKIKDLYISEGIDTTINLNILPDFSTNRFNLKKEVFFNVQSMLDAYFSFQEHVLILLLPFTNIDFTKNKITDLINANWSKIFNTVLSPSNSPDLMRHYDNLRNIKELRNQYAHGGFEKNDGSILPHIEGIGIIPIELSSDNEYKILYLHDYSYKEICDVIDKFEEHLISSDWLMPIKIIQSGLDISLNEEFVLKLNMAIESNECVDEFLEYTFSLEDKDINMEW